MSDIERKVIALLSTPEHMAEAWDLGLRRDVFEEPINEALFNHIVDYWHESNTRAVPTPLVLQTDFPGVRIPNEVEEELPWLVRTLQNRFIENQAQEMMREAAVTLSEEPKETLHRLFEKAYEAAEAVAPRNSRSDMSNIDERRMRYGMREDDQQGGVTFGLHELDLHTRGLMPGELAVTGGFAKTGKSMFLVNSAVAARRAGYTPIIMTLEMAKEEIEDRIDSFFSGVSYDRLSKGQLGREELDFLRASQEELRDLGPLYVEKPQRGERTVRNMVSRARTLGANYIIIDQLSFMDSPNRHRDLKGKHSEIIFDLKDEINRESAGKIPCLLAVQFNRQTQNNGGRGSMENFANASEIEQTCDIALGLWRTREMRENRSMQLDIMGSRRCDIQSYALSWELVDNTNISVQPDVEPQ